MDNFDTILEKYTKHLTPVILNFHDTFPNAQAITNECTQEHVAEIIKRITILSIERHKVSDAEEVDFDLLDDYWRATVRYSNLLTYLTKKYPNEILLGLQNPEPSTRFYIASAIYQTPFVEAVENLKAALDIEKDEPTKGMLAKALAASEYRELTWGMIFSKIGKILGITRYSGRRH